MATTADGDSNSINDCDRNRGTQNKSDTKSLCGVLYCMITMIFFPDPNSSLASTTVLHRVKTTLSENSPLLRDATTLFGRSILLWTQRGSPLRALLVISVGTTIFLALTGLLIFLIYLLVATFIAVVISLLMSLAAIAAFLAIIFACVTTIYIGALTLALFVISTVTFTAILAAIIFTGWIGFFWVVWLAMGKCVAIAKRSLA